MTPEVPPPVSVKKDEMSDIDREIAKLIKKREKKKEKEDKKKKKRKREQRSRTPERRSRSKERSYRKQKERRQSSSRNVLKPHRNIDYLQYSRIQTKSM